HCHEQCDGSYDYDGSSDLPSVSLPFLPAAQLQKEHITETMAIERAKPATAVVFTVFACILGALVSIAFAWFGLMKALENTAIGSTADVSAVITWPVYYLVPVVFVLLAVLYILDVVAMLRRRTEAEEGQ